MRFSSLGDIVMGTAMIRCLRLRFPNAQIDMVVRADFLDLISDNPHLTHKWGLERNEGIKGLWKFYRQIQTQNYDLIYDAHRSLRTRLLMPLLRSRYKAYFKKNYFKRGLALTFKLPLLKNAPRMLERYIYPLEKFGVKDDQKGPELYLSSENATSASTKFPLDINRRYVGLIPSAQWPGKRWPDNHFRSVLIELLNSTAYTFLIFGGKRDHFCQKICADLSPDRVVNTQGQLSIAEAGSLLKRCDYVIANDTGLMHVADALKIPQILILGPTSREIGCLPFHPQSKVAEKNLWCRPCSKNGQAPCIRGRRICLEAITPSSVVQLSQSFVPTS